MRESRRLRRVTSLLAACGLLVAATPALASKGAAIDVGRIDIEQALTPGGSYILPTIGVRNPGTERTRYTMVANALEDPEREAPPAEWFRFDPEELTLSPGETRPVRARIVLPTGADPGDYVALVGAQIVAGGGGAQVGAAAAARTTFRVEPASTLEAWWLKTKAFFSDHAPWSYVIPLVVFLALVASRVRRRFEFRVARRTP